VVARWVLLWLGGCGSLHCLMGCDGIAGVKSFP